MSTLSSVFWDRVFSVTGFRRRDIENLREPVHADGTPTPTDKDVTETVELCELSWANRDAVDKLRADLQGYITVLRSLKGENFARSQSRIHARNFVEDARYKALRQREAAQRITTSKVVGMFKKLTLDDAGVAHVDADAEPFAALEELYLSRNAIDDVRTLPPELRILSVCASGVRHIHLDTSHKKLLFASFAANELNSLAFIDSMPALVVLDVSFNAICDIEDVITMLDSHPEITRVDMRGNPVCLVEGYRRRVCSAAPRLQYLDGIAVSDSDRTAPARENPDVTGFSDVAQATLSVTGVKDFALALNTGDQDENQAQAAAAAKDAKGAKGKADPKAKTKGKGAAEEAGATTTNFATKRSVSLAAEWCGASLACDDVEAAIQAVSDVDPAADAGGKGKGGKDKKAAVAAPAEATGAGEAQAEPKPVLKCNWPLGGRPVSLAKALAQPCVLQLVTEDVTMQAAGTSPVPMNTSSLNLPDPQQVPVQRQRLALGHVQLDFSGLANTAVTTPQPPHEPFVLKAAATGSLVIDTVALAERRYAIDRLREELAEATADEERLERQLADAMRLPTPPVDEAPAAASTKPGGKKAAPAAGAGKGGKSAPTATLSDEAARLQEQVAQAKQATEEKQGQLAAAQRALAAHEACSGMQISAQVTIACAGPDTLRPEPEVDALAATTNAVNPKDAKKGKK